MSTNNKNKHSGMPGRGDALQPPHASVAGDQRTQQAAGREPGVSTGNQFLPPGAHRTPPQSDRTHPQTSAYGAVPTSDASAAHGPYYRQTPSTMSFENSQSFLGAGNDNNTFSGWQPDVDYGVQGIHNRADNININLNWTPPLPTLPRINGMMSGRDDVVVPPPYPSNNHTQQQFGSQPQPQGFGSTQNYPPPPGTHNPSSVLGAIRPTGQHDVEMRPLYTTDRNYTSSDPPFDYDAHLGSSYPDLYDLGLVSGLHSCVAGSHDGTLNLLGSLRQTQETARRILRFGDLELEAVVDFVAPEHTNINLAYATHDAAVQGVRDSFRLDGMYWESPKSDSSIPRTHAQRQEIVRILLAAMKDPSQAIDREMRSFKKRWAADAPKKYSDLTMEATCWKMAELSERLHVEGPTVLCVASENALATNKESASFTFAQRIQYLVVLLTQFKARCENLIKGTFLHTVVGNPKDALENSHLNAIVNPKRQKYLAYALENMTEDKTVKRKRSRQPETTRSGNVTLDEFPDSDAREDTSSSSNGGSRKRIRTSPGKGA